MTYQTWISWISTLWQALRKSYDNPAEVASSFADIPFFLAYVGRIDTSALN